MSKLCSKKKEADLTRENLQRGEWKEMQFKGHNFSAKGLPVEVVIYIHCSRFEEMPRNNYVGSSFSNLMYFINRNNTLPVIHITPSFHEVLICKHVHKSAH